MPLEIEDSEHIFDRCCYCGKGIEWLDMSTVAVCEDDPQFFYHAHGACFNDPLYGLVRMLKQMEKENEKSKAAV